MTGKPQTPQEQWQAIKEFARGGQAPSVARPRDDEVSAELRALGMDPHEVGQRGEDFVLRTLRAMEAGRASDDEPAPPEAGPSVAAAEPAETDWSEREHRTGLGWSMKVLLAAAVATVGAGTAITLSLRDRAPPEPSPGPTRSSPSPEMVAAKLRAEANEACAGHDWQTCIARLDEAKALDPAGDPAPQVKADRERAALGMKEDNAPRDPPKTGGDGTRR